MDDDRRLIDTLFYRPSRNEISSVEVGLGGGVEIDLVATLVTVPTCGYWSNIAVKTKGKIKFDINNIFFFSQLVRLFPKFTLFCQVLPGFK